MYSFRLLKLDLYLTPFTKHIEEQTQYNKNKSLDSTRRIEVTREERKYLIGKEDAMDCRGKNMYGYLSAGFDEMYFKSSEAIILNKLNFVNKYNYTNFN